MTLSATAVLQHPAGTIAIDKAADKASAKLKKLKANIGVLSPTQELAAPPKKRKRRSTSIQEAPAGATRRRSSSAKKVKVAAGPPDVSIAQVEPTRQIPPLTVERVRLPPLRQCAGPDVMALDLGADRTKCLPLYQLLTASECYASMQSDCISLANDTRTATPLALGLSQHETRRHNNAHFLPEPMADPALRRWLRSVRSDPLINPSSLASLAQDAESSSVLPAGMRSTGAEEMITCYQVPTWTTLNPDAIRLSASHRAQARQQQQQMQTQMQMQTLMETSALIPPGSHNVSTMYMPDAQHALRLRASMTAFARSRGQVTDVIAACNTNTIHPSGTQFIGSQQQDLVELRTAEAEMISNKHQQLASMATWKRHLRDSGHQDLSSTSKHASRPSSAASVTDLTFPRPAQVATFGAFQRKAVPPPIMIPALQRDHDPLLLPKATLPVQMRREASVTSSMSRKTSDSLLSLGTRRCSTPAGIDCDESICASTSKKLPALHRVASTSSLYTKRSGPCLQHSPSLSLLGQAVSDSSINKHLGTVILSLDFKLQKLSVRRPYTFTVGAQAKTLARLNASSG